MNDMFARATALAICLVALPPTASGTTIVDTGDPPATLGGFLFSGDHWRADEFSTGPVVVTSVEGWIANFGGNQTFTVALYSDGGDVPGTLLFSEQVTTPPTMSVGWRGASGLSWQLVGGDYWAAFEVRPGDNMFGAFPDPAPIRLNEAFSQGAGLGWSNTWPTISTIGVRINGTLLDVPEPSTLALIALGVAGLGFSRRRE